MKSGLMNKAFLITGASGGIGRATAQAFAEEGARLALHYHTNRESVEEGQDIPVSESPGDLIEPPPLLKEVSWSRCASRPGTSTL